MIKEVFIGKLPSNFSFNPTVKAFIVSETLVWSAWNLVTPIFAIFAVNEIPGSNIGIAGSVFSAYLIVRVICELLSGRYLMRSTAGLKFKMSILGIILLSLAYLGFAFSNSLLLLFVFYGLAGIGMGIASPAKASLFSSHIDKRVETVEWGLYDAIVFIGMALAAALGGFIADKYGFRLLFILAAVLNLVGSLPYLMFVQRQKTLMEKIEDVVRI